MSTPGDDEGGEPEATPRQRKLRAGARPKVSAYRELRRQVLRHAPEARGYEKVVRELRAERPVVRGDCKGGQRPCPWVSCKYHLALSVNPESGAITLNFPDRDVWELRETCALDVADRGEVTLEEIGELVNVTRERIRQVEFRALRLIRSSAGGRGLR